MVWRLHWKSGGEDWFYVYFLLEFQSTVDAFMAVRLLRARGHRFPEVQRHSPGLRS